MTDALMTLHRAARALGVTAAWLHSEAAAGRVPCLRAGRRYLFAVEAVRTVLTQRAATERQGVAHA